MEEERIEEINTHLRSKAKTEEESKTINYVIEEALKTKEPEFVLLVMLKILSGDLPMFELNKKNIKIFINSAVSFKEKKQPVDVVEFAKKHNIDLEMKSIQVLADNFNYILYQRND